MGGSSRFIVRLNYFLHTPIEMRNLREIKNMAAVILMMAGLVVFYWPTWAGLAERWNYHTHSYSHGYLIALVSLVLLLRSASSMSQSESQYRWIAAVAIVGVSAAWLVAYFTNVLVVQAVLLPIICFCGLATVFGPSGARPFVFPLMYFYLAVPIWDVLIGLLQAMTIEVNAGILGLLRIPALIEESFVFLPSGTLEISDGCAGLHFFIVGLAISSLYAHQTLVTAKYRILLVGLVVTLSILMNWVRVTTIIVVAYVTDMQHYLVTVDHYAFGWVLFAILLVPLTLVGHKMERLEGRQHQLPDRSETNAVDYSAFAVSTRHIGFAIVLLAAMPLTGVVLDRSVDRGHFADLDVPRSVGDWTWQTLVPPTWAPQFAGAEQEIHGQYVLGDEQIEFYVNRFARQSQGSELISSSNSLFDRAKWRERDRSTVLLNLSDGTVMRAKQLEVVSRDAFKQYFVYWYLVSDKVLVNSLDVKYHEFLQRLVGHAGSGVVAVRIECRHECESKLEDTLDFLRAHGAQINSTLFASLARSENKSTVAE